MGDRIDSVPDLTAEAPKALGWSGGAPTQDEPVLRDLDGQTITCLNSQATARAAWYGDLVLGADLDA